MFGSPSDPQWLSERDIDLEDELHEYFTTGCGLPVSTQDDKGYKTCQNWPIGLKMYAENGDDMGAMKGWIFASYGRTPLRQSWWPGNTHVPSDADTKVSGIVIAVYDRCNCSSSFDVDPFILKKISFSREEILDIAA